MYLKLYPCGVGTRSRVCLISEFVLQALQVTQPLFFLSLVLRLSAFPTTAGRVDNDAPRIKLSHSRKYFPVPWEFSWAPHALGGLCLFFYKNGLASRAGEEVNAVLSHIIPDLTTLLCPLPPPIPRDPFPQNLNLTSCSLY